MSAITLPPPAPPNCLTRSYKSRGHKGGTIIAEDVRDLETHRKKLLDPDEYRSVISSCWACGGKVLHALCFRERVLRGARDTQPLVETVRMYNCAAKACGAVFTVLPAAIARNLWRLWKTVEDAAGNKLEVPRSTFRRWLGRLGSSASQLVQTLSTKASSLISPGFCTTLGKVSTRSDLLETFRRSLVRNVDFFAPLAVWIHRLEPGIRLM